MTRGDKLLSAIIFVLWSLGVFVIPALLATVGGALWRPLVESYLALHAVAGAFVLTLVPHAWRALARGARYARPRAALYIYVLAMLGVSGYFIWIQLF